MYEFPFGAGQQLNLNWIINEIITLHKQLDPDYELPNFDTAFPYMNLNTLNLDWILTELKALKELAPPAPPLSSDDVQNDSTVSGNTVTNALDTLQAALGNLDSDDIDNASQVAGAAITDALNNLNISRTTLQVTSIDDIATSLNRFVSFGTAINMAGITIPQYAKGVLVSQGGADATIYAISLEGKIYTAFRNNGTWVNGKCLNNEISDLNSAISAITPLDTTPTNGSTKGITSDAVFDAVNALNTKQIYTANWYAESSSASDVNLTYLLALPKGVYLFVVGFPDLSSKALVQLVCTSGTIAQQVSNGIYGYTAADSQTSWAGIFEVTSNNAEFRVRSAQSTAFTMSYIERGFIRAVQLAKSST